MASSSRLIVAAIDFGTTFSGWAFSFKHDYDRDPTKATVKLWNEGTLMTEKTPTCLLLKPDGTFDAFGYDAESKYSELADKNEHMHHYYFRHFKMSLFKQFGKQELKREMSLTDEMGKILPAINVFAMSIKYLADDMMSTLKQRFTGRLEPGDIHWVITVPAIWSDAAKQFMKEAALKAGLTERQLTIALEPEAASIYCRHVPLDTTKKEEEVSIVKLPKGSKYMILDAGGGTIDITVHQVQDKNTLREVVAPDGGEWGGIVVDKAFEMFWKELVGEDLFEQFKIQETEDWLFMQREFEMKKRKIRITSPRVQRMHLPASLVEFCEKVKRLQFADVIASTKYAELVEIKRDKIILAKNVFFYMFGPPLEKTVYYVKNILSKDEAKDLRTILMVGGFSESLLLQQAIKEAFPEKEIIVPSNASSTVLRGAIIFGHYPVCIAERTLRYTYGGNKTALFEPLWHSEEKRIESDDGLRCTDIFDKYVEKGQKVKLGDFQVKMTYLTIHKNQKHVGFHFYASDNRNPYYVDEEGCTHIGYFRITLDEPDENIGRQIRLCVAFGGTEIIAQAEDTSTGNIAAASIDFLG